MREVKVCTGCANKRCAVCQTPCSNASEECANEDSGVPCKAMICKHCWKRISMQRQEGVRTDVCARCVSHGENVRKCHCCKMSFNLRNTEGPRGRGAEGPGCAGGGDSMREQAFMRRASFHEMSKLS